MKIMKTCVGICFRSDNKQTTKETPGKGRKKKHKFYGVCNASLLNKLSIKLVDCSGQKISLSNSRKSEK